MISCHRLGLLVVFASMSSGSALASTDTSSTAGTATSSIASVTSTRSAQAPSSTPSARDSGLRIPTVGGLELVIDAAYRPRFIGDTGRDLVDARHKAFVNHRARIGLSLTHTSGLRLIARVQDVRTWGEEEPSPVNDFHADGIDFHEAYASIPLAEGLALRVGRQEIAWDNDRLLGNIDWVQRAQSFDAVRLLGTVERHALSRELFIAKVREADVEPDGHVPADRKLDIDLAGLRVAYDRSPRYRLAALYLFNGNYGLRERRHTFGINASGSLSALRYSAEGYLQLGQLTANGASEGVLAYLVAASLGYVVSEVPWQPSLTVMADLVSGDGTRAGAFDTLYATNHKFYGEMDFFLDLPRHTANLGLADLAVKLAVSPSGWAKVGLDYHHLRGMKKSATGATTFGQEIDLRCILAPMEHVSISALYGVLLPDDMMRVRFPSLPAGAELRPEHFVYVTTEVKL